MHVAASWRISHARWPLLTKHGENNTAQMRACGVLDVERSLGKVQRNDVPGNLWSSKLKREGWRRERREIVFQGSCQRKL